MHSTTQYNKYKIIPSGLIVHSTAFIDKGLNLPVKSLLNDVIITARLSYGKFLQNRGSHESSGFSCVCNII